MPEVDLAKTEWPEYFAALAAESAGAATSVQVLSSGELERAAQLLGWSLCACAYDGASDLLELALASPGAGEPGLRYFVSRPRRIRTRESQRERTVAILDAGGVETVMRVHRRPSDRFRAVSSSYLYGRKAGWRTLTREAPRRTGRAPGGGGVSWS